MGRANRTCLSKQCRRVVELIVIKTTKVLLEVCLGFCFQCLGKMLLPLEESPNGKGSQPKQLEKMTCHSPRHNNRYKPVVPHGFEVTDPRIAGGGRRQSAYDTSV